jgi:hypothetical protein
VSPRITGRADYIDLAVSLCITEDTRCLFQAAVPLIYLSNLKPRLANAGWHESFDHDLIALNYGSPYAAEVTAVAGCVWAFHMSVSRIVNPELRPFGHIEAGDAQVMACCSR